MGVKISQIFCLLLTLLFWTPSGGLFALPQGESVESGSATFERPDPSTTNNILTLNVIAGDKSVINFNSFNIGQNEAVYFIQPSASASVLSRVTGAGASEIAGILSANGTLFFVNQNGMRFAPSARVNVNSLIASTLDISTNNFVNGNYILEHSLDGVYAQILNEGRITANNIALVASGVHNSGVIAARAGTAHLTSGDKVTVSFDQKGLIQVEINQETSGRVVDLQGKTVRDAVANSGTIEAREVVMSAKTAANIFENAVNQSGIVKATAISQEGGVIRIRANRNIQLSGSLEAPAGGITVSSGESIAVKAELNTVGNTNIMADKDIDVSANIATVNGDLSLIADADLDGAGSFRQAPGTLISTLNYGDILIQSSGESQLSSIASAGDLILKQGGAAAIFTQYPNSLISAAGSLNLGQGVTLKAANTLYRIGKDVINSGAFYPQDSLFELVSAQPAIIRGDITFNDFKVIVPGKQVDVTAGATIKVEGILTLQGSYGNLLTLVSTEPGKQWKILPLGETDIAYAQIGDCFNARGPPLKAVHSSSLGNNSNLDLDPYWTGQGLSSNWSDPDNWDSGTIPTAFDTVTFDGITGLNPNKNSLLDPAFGGMIANFIVNGYTGVITLQRDLTVTSNISLQTGLLIAGSQTLTIGGDWSASTGTFQAGTSQVIFNDVFQISHLSGSTTFYDLTCLTPGKKLVFGAGTLTTVQNTLTIEGNDTSHVILTSSIEAKGSEFGIYMAKVSDLEGNAYLEYLDVYYSTAYGPLVPIPAKHYYIPAELNNDWDDTHTWSGTNSASWSLGANWVGGTAPVANDDLVFPDNLVSLRYTTTNDFAAATAFNSITIQGTSYVLGGANSITLAGGITDSHVGGSNTISFPIVLSGTRTITVSDAGENLTISNVISGNTFGITKAGSGTLTLSGASTYTGAVTISAGTLSVNMVANAGIASPLGTGAGTPAISMGGGTLQYTGSGHSSSRAITLTASGSTIDASGAGTLTLSGGIGSGVTYNIVLTGTGNGIISGNINTNAGTVTKNGSGTWTLSAANSYTGLTTINAGTLKYGIANAINSGSVTVNNTGIYDWSNFADSIATLTVNDGGKANCSGNGNLTVSALTINSGINGGGLVATGAGTLTLGGNITSTGGYTNALISGNLALSATRTFTLTNAVDGLTISALISNTSAGYGITKAGNGILTLTGASTYTGAVTISAGILSVNSVADSGTPSPLGTGAGTSAISISGTGTLQYTGSGHSTNRNIAPSASGAIIDASGSGQLTLAGGIGTGVAYNIVLTGTGTGSIITAIINTSTGTLTKNGSGTWTVGIANSTYSGTTTINGGTLKAGIANAFPTAAVTVNNTGIYDWNSYVDTIGALTVNDGGQVICTGGGAILTISTLAINSGINGGGLVATGAGTLTLGGNVTSTGGYTNALISGNLALGATRTFTLTNPADGLTISALISGAGFGITKAGSGILTLTGASTYTGAVTISAGILSVNSVANSGTASPLGTGAGTSAIGISGTGTLQYTGSGHSTNRNIAPSASGAIIDASGSGQLTLAGGIGTGVARNIVLTGTGTGCITTTIINTSTGTLTKNGSGTWILTEANTYSGITTINSGTLSVSIMRNGNVASGIGASSNAATNLVINGGTFQYIGGTSSTDRLFTIGTTAPVILDASGTGTLTFTNILAMTLSGLNTARTITFAGTGSAVLTNIIPDNGTGATSVVKNDPGTWTFNAANTYSGTTTINAGILKIAADSGLGTAPGIATPGEIVFNGGILQTTGSFILNANRGIALSGSGTIFTDSTTTLTYAGSVDGAGTFTKDGEGTLILQGANTYSSDTTVNSGTLTLSGASGSALNSTSFTVNPEATLVLDNSTANNSDRIADTAGIIMNGGNFYFLGSNSESASESVGALTIAAGSNYVNVLDDTGGFTIMRFDSFFRVTGAMVLFRGTDLGSSPSANVSTIMFTAAPALTGGGGAAGTTTVSIIQGAFGSSSRSGTGTDMVTYNLADDPNGLRLLNGGGFSGEYETAVLTVPNSNVKLSGSVVPGAGITINSLILSSGGGVASSANTLTIGSGNILAFAANTGINGTTVLAFGTGPGIIRAVGDLVISSRITGSGGLTTGGSGAITLSNAGNSYTGDNRFSQGTVIIAADADLGAGSGATNITLFGATLRTTGTFALSSGRGIMLKGSSVIFTDPATTLTYNGVISGTKSLTKSGAGTLLLGGTNTYSGATTVNAGALTLSGVNSYAGATTINAGSLTLSGANGTAVNSASFTINQGGVLTLDNSTANNTNRINDGAPIILNGGEFVFKGSNVAATNATEAVGAMTLSTGDSTVTVFSGTGGRTMLTFDSASRVLGTTVLFRGANLGANPGAGNTNIIFADDTDLRLTGGNGAAGSTTINIVPYALGDTAVAGTGIGFVTHNIDTNGNINGIRPLVLASEYDNTNAPASSATLNVRLTASYSPNSNRTWNCLILDLGAITYTIGTSNTRVLTLTSGALFSSGTSAKTLAGGANYSWTASTAPANEFIIFTNQNLTITAAMLNTNTPGLTKSGPGTLTLSSVAKAYTGATTINEGSIIVGLANVINSGSSVMVAAGGTFALGNFNQQITALTLYSGGTGAASVTTGTGILTLGGNIILYVNGSGAVGATISTTGTGSLALGGNRVFTVNDGTAAADLSISLPITGAYSITKQGDGTLTLSGNNTYSAGMNLNAGALNINSATALGAAASRFTVAAGTSFDNTSGSSITLTNNNPQTWNGDIIFTGSNNLIMGTGAVTMSADLVVTVSANTLTVGAINNGTYSLTKAGAGTLTLAGALTVNNLTITAGTLDVGAGNNAVNVAGNWFNSGIFNCRNGTVTFGGGSSIIDPGGTSDSQDFYAVIINSTGTKTLAGPILINNVLTVSAGVLAGDYDVTVKGGGVTGNGTINMTDGTFTVQGTGNFGNSTSAWTFFNLTFGDGVAVAATTKTGTNTINVTGTLVVALNHTLQAGNATTWNLIWSSYLKNIIMIASGTDHTIALTDDGYVFAWGCNFYGQLGDGTTNDASTPVQVLGVDGIGFLSGISRIAAGGYHSVALKDDGSVYAWGYNEQGQLGNNTKANSSTPVQVLGVNNIYRVAAGGNETAAISATGYVYCWGYNGQGELGNNSIIDSPVPVQVLSGEQGGGTYLHNISRVAVGGAHVIALTADGYVYSWGYNADGELGNGLTADSHTPVQVLSGEQGGGTYLRDITQISAGDTHNLALDIGGFVYSWGYNGFGELGNGTNTDAHSPVQVLCGTQGGTYLHNVTRISAGEAHSLAIADGGFVYSWGQNSGLLGGQLWGQLGDGTTTNRNSPVKVLAGDQSSTDTYLQGIAEISAGGAQTVTLSSGNRVFNCGNNANGQLGNGSFAVGAVDQIRVQAGSQQVGPAIRLVVNGTLNNQTAIINIYLSSVRYTDLAITNNHSANYWLSGDTMVTGNFSINSATLNAGSYSITVSGNWTNTSGTFNAGTGSVTLNSATQTQSVTSGGSAFNILTVTNSYTGGVAFVDRLVTAYLNAGSGVKKLSFSAASSASPHTVTAGFNVNGSAGSLIELAPLVAATTWYLSTPTTTLHYLKISYSHEVVGQTITATNSLDPNPGSNTNWNITP